MSLDRLQYRTTPDILLCIEASIGLPLSPSKRSPRLMERTSESMPSEAHEEFICQVADPISESPGVPQTYCFMYKDCAKVLDLEVQT